ncbi:MAG: DctP family TRAP transporter solute-binding subunit [Sedimentibacter sp.]
MKKIISIVLIVALCFSMVACSNSGSGGNQAAKVKTIKVAHWFAEDHPQHISLLKFKEILEANSNGAFKVEVYPNSQLGSEDVYDDSVSQGTVEMAATGTLIQKWVPQIAITEAPFLFNGWDDAQQILTGEIGELIVKDLPEKANMRCIAITVNGFRQMSSNLPMNNMDELASQRFRTPNIPHFIKMMDELGAVSIPMPMSEIFTALETGVADGQENPYPTIFTSSFYEVQDYVLESNHMFSPNFWVVSEKFYQGLSDEEKTLFDAAIKEAAEYNWEISKSANDEAKAGIQEGGSTIIVPDDAFKKQMQDAMGSVYEYFYQQTPASEEIVSMIRDYQAAN